MDNGSTIDNEHRAYIAHAQMTDGRTATGVD